MLGSSVNIQNWARTEPAPKKPHRRPTIPASLPWAKTPASPSGTEYLCTPTTLVGGSPPAELAWVEPILELTTTLQVATGTVNIWTAPAKAVAESFRRIDQAYPGRFLLGIGAGHRAAISEYRKPCAALAQYFDRLDDYGVPAQRRVLAALGPRVLGLSAQRSAGAHPYLTTPEHTARAVGRKALDVYLNLTN